MRLLCMAIGICLGLCLIADDSFGICRRLCGIFASLVEFFGLRGFFASFEFGVSGSLFGGFFGFLW